MLYSSPIQKPCHKATPNKNMLDSYADSKSILYSYAESNITLYSYAESILDSVGFYCSGRLIYLFTYSIWWIRSTPDNFAIMENSDELLFLS